ISMAEARIERLRARLAELTRRLEQNRKKIKFGDVMQILETYLRRRYKEQQDDLIRLSSAPLFWELYVNLRTRGISIIATMGDDVTLHYR
ncbi:hypothetical protein MIMGU_mgv1a023423mg, partial [Erythranthe guttata]